MAKKIKELAKRTIENLLDAALPRRSARMSADGSENLDSTPVALPVHLQRRGSTLDEVRAAIGLINREAEINGTETEDEFYDFELDDDLPMDTRWTAAAEALDLAPDQLRAYLGYPEPEQPNPLGTRTPHARQPHPEGSRAPDGEQTKPPSPTAKRKNSEPDPQSNGE